MNTTGMMTLEGIGLLIKAVGDILVPIVLLYFGFGVKKAIGRIENLASLRRDLMARRFGVYEAIVDGLNTIFCYATYRGHFRSVTPEQILDLKRNLDARFVAKCILWDDETLAAYSEFMNACFATQRGRGTSAIIIADRSMHADRPDYPWFENYNDLFVKPEEFQRITENARKGGSSGHLEFSYRKDVVVPAYAALVARLSAGLGGHVTAAAAEKWFGC
ncbi:MAG: hypothetical protein JNK85_22520 [Verrucomicrobiales bacterium]|nr:hypothetical protein [Verrucomicrobiales bacterium]